MKVLFKTMLTFALLICYSIPFAQNSPDFKSLKVKFMKMDDKYYVFLTDTSGATYPNKNVSVTVKSDADELFSPKIPTAPFQENGFVLNKTPGNFRTLKFDFQLKEQKEHLRTTVSNKHEDQSGFLCPMHPTQVFQSEGVCAICSMALVTKKISVYAAVP